MENTDHGGHHYTGGGKDIKANGRNKGVKLKNSGETTQVNQSTWNQREQ